jgi:hypothetical protein
MRDLRNKYVISTLKKFTMLVGSGAGNGMFMYPMRPSVARGQDHIVTILLTSLYLLVSLGMCG